MIQHNKAYIAGPIKVVLLYAAADFHARPLLSLTPYSLLGFLVHAHARSIFPLPSAPPTPHPPGSAHTSIISGRTAESQRLLTSFNSIHRVLLFDCGMFSVLWISKQYKYYILIKTCIVYGNSRYVFNICVTAL